MNHLSYMEKLLDGVEVEWKPLEEVIHSLKTGLNPRQNFQLNTSDAQGYYVTVREIQDGKIVFLDKTDRVNDRALELINGRSKLEVGDILFSGTGTVGRTAIIEEKPANWNIKEGVYTIKPIQEKILPRFLSHLLNSSEIVKDYSKKIVGNPVVSLPMGELKKLLIPIPCPDNPEKSLEIQAEIVRILDAFTAMTAELTAELNMRKKQYNYYRDQLLGFEEGDVEWKTLGWIGEVRMCKRIMKNETSDIGDIPFFKIGTFGKEPNAYISRDTFEEYKSKYNYPRVGEILISASGTIGRAVIFNGEDAYFQDSNIVWLENDESKVLNKYLFYFYQIANWNVSDGGVIKRLYNDNIKKTLIPVPYPNEPERSLAEQARVVAILDKFDTLTTSIQEGLPREIELRQKQYEYYRDLLLSFPASPAGGPKSHSDEAA